MRYTRVMASVAALIALAAAGFILHARRMSGPGANPAAASWTPISEQRLSHGRFENVTVYVPHSAPRGVVLLLSGADGWNDSMADMAKQIAGRGALVVGLDVAKFNASLETDGGQCVFPDGDLENLSRFVQAYFRLPGYLTPILAGESTGGTLAYAALVQSPKDTFAGAVSTDFCPTYLLKKTLCKGSGIEFTTLPHDTGMDFLPAKTPGISWTVVQRDNYRVCEVEKVRAFVAQVPGAQFASVPALGGDAMISAFDTLMARHPPPVVAAVPRELGDLPIVTVPPVPGSTQSDTLALILSGDGGWAGLDKDVAGALAAAGIPVIGLDSLRYFWSARTPAGLAADIDRMARYYLKSLGKQRMLLIGYSQGADVLPFAVNRLDPATRSHVALTAVMGMSEHALFEFHMTSWIADDNSGPATLPEVDRITGMPVLCIYGDQEDDTLCPKLDSHKATVVKLKGGHHFDGDYAGLARIILAAAQPH